MLQYPHHDENLLAIQKKICLLIEPTPTNSVTVSNVPQSVYKVIMQEREMLSNEYLPFKSE